MADRMQLSSPRAAAGSCAAATAEPAAGKAPQSSSAKARTFAFVVDDSKPEFHDHPLEPETVLLGSPVPIRVLRRK
eukprot:SAG11_NODE_3535_length_2386_cov_2.303017_1_plen_76_part_00